MATRHLLHEDLTRSVIGAFFETYNILGFGFLEHIYVLALERELTERGHRIGREVSVPVFYKGTELGRQRIDMIVDERIVVEVKSSLVIPVVAERQVYNYLRGTHLNVGLLLHYGPDPKFYRKYSPLLGNRVHPLHPDSSGAHTSVGPAGATTPPCDQLPGNPEQPGSTKPITQADRAPPRRAAAPSAHGVP